MFLRILRIISRLILKVIARVDMDGPERVPPAGGIIVAANHLGRLDALLAFILSDREDVIVVIAEKYQEQALWRWFARRLDAIWINRYQTDFHALREVYRRLRAGGMLIIAPEGTRSQTEALLPGKPGTAYLAIKADVPIWPVGIYGTEDRVVKDRLRRLQRLDIVIRGGHSFDLPPLRREDRDAQLEEYTEEIMCQIAAVLPAQYRGVYADHPRLREILASQPANQPTKPPANLPAGAATN